MDNFPNKSVFNENLLFRRFSPRDANVEVLSEKNSIAGAGPWDQGVHEYKIEKAGVRCQRR